MMETRRRPTWSCREGWGVKAPSYLKPATGTVDLLAKSPPKAELERAHELVVADHASFAGLGHVTCSGTACLQ